MRLRPRLKRNASGGTAAISALGWRLLRCRRGAVATISAITLSVMIGFIGLGTEVSLWFVMQRSAQGAADAAAISAAFAPNSLATMTTQAKTVATLNGYTDGVNGVTVRVYNPPNDGPNTANLNAIEVVISQKQSRMLSGLFLSSDPTFVARSVSETVPQVYCILSLSSATTAGVTLTGLGTFQMPNCSIGDNAKGPNALTLNAFLFLQVNAYTATVDGAFNCCGFDFANPALNVTRAAKINTGTTIPDPYACPGANCRAIPTPATPPVISTISVPAVPGTCKAAIVQANGSQTINSGANNCYKGVTVSGSGHLTFGNGNFTIYGATVSGGSLTMGTGTSSIYGLTATGGSVTLGAGTYTIVGQTGHPGISVGPGGGTVTLNSLTNSIQGASAQPAISLTGGTLAMGTSTNTILGGSGNPGINVAGGTLTMGTSTGTNAIQPGTNTQPAVNIIGGSVAMGNGTFVIGPATVHSGQPAINLTSGGSGTGPGLSLGSGTYTIMEGINLTGSFLSNGLTLNPPATATGAGTYIIVGGKFNMGFGDLTDCNSGFLTSGCTNNSGVTIVLTGSGSDFATFDSTGADGVTLSAPTTGPRAGMAIMQDPRAPGGGSNAFLGLSFVNVQGALYFPSQALTFTGANIMNSPCMQLIASTINITGLDFMNDNCTGTGVVPIILAGPVGLIE